MKMWTIIGIALLSVAITAYLFVRDELPSIPAANAAGGTEKMAASADIPHRPPAASISQSNKDLTDFGSVLTPQEKERLAAGYVLTTKEREKKLKKKRAMDLSPTMDELDVMGKTPVEFYGLVLDQFDQPVVGTKIRCSWPYMGPQHSALELQSGLDGRFEVLGLKALAIHVSAYPPPGYDAQVSDSKDVQFAEVPTRILQLEDYKAETPEGKKVLGQMHGFGEAHKPDKTKPVIFRLKKL